MMTGYINRKGAALIPGSLIKNPINGNRIFIQNILIDTGFEGYLFLSRDIILTLELPFRSSIPLVLANGTQTQQDLYKAIIYWDGYDKEVEVIEMDAEPLLGMAMLQGYKLGIEAISNGKVTITKLP